MRVSKQELVSALAQELKSLLKKPEWADFVKTGMHKERPPMNHDWWYARAGSILLKVKRLGPIGVSKLRTKYGGKKNRGVKPERFYRGSGSIIRKLLQQLESAGLLKQEAKGRHKGRVLTPKAYSLIAKSAKAVDKPKPKVSIEKPKPVPKAPVKEEPKKVEIKKEPEEKVEVKKEETKVEIKK
nr:30S ribosomal protein S19e [Nanoarchaeota archaeon]